MDSPQAKFSLVPVFVALALVSPLVVLALTGVSPQDVAKLAAPLLILTAATGAYFTRKRPVGGVLFIFFFQLLCGVVAVIGTASEKFLPPPPSHDWQSSGRPSNEQGPKELYGQKGKSEDNLERRVLPKPNAGALGLRILANVPFYLAFIIAVVFAWRAIARRDLTRLRELRRSYILLFGMSLLGVLVDGIVFPGSLAQSILVLIWTASWYGYLFWSHRVEWVLGRGEWDFPKFSARFDVISGETLARIRKISLLIIVAFGGLLLAFTLALSYTDNAGVVGIGMLLAPFLLVVGMAARAVLMRRALRMSGGGSVAAVKVQETERIPGEGQANKERRKSAGQRWVLMCIGLLAILAIMFPPFVIHAPNGMILNGGFSFLFSSGNALALVNTGLLGLELLVIGIVGAVAWLIARD